MRPAFGRLRGMSPSDEAAPPTLFEWAGGASAFDALIDRFYDRVEQDDLLSALFPGGVSRAHRDHVSAWWQEVFGGPTRYGRTELGVRREAGNVVGSST